MLVESSLNLIPIYCVTEPEFEKFKARLNANEKTFCDANQFNGKSGSQLIINDAKGEIKKVLLGHGKNFNPSLFGALGRNLPTGEYEIKSRHKMPDLEQSVLFFALGCYFYDEFKATPRKDVKLKAPSEIDFAKVQNLAKIICEGRDLINKPANIMGPNQIADFAKNIAKANQLKIDEFVGNELLENNYPLIHAVGRASNNEPRFLIIRKPKENAPKIGIIGKGVSFDTGGLNLKPGSSMALMKKDMGGAACAITLFRILLEQNLDIDLNLYLPLVENSVAGNSMRPGDIINSRKGLSVEIDNTDAEGRLILADALTRASEDEMDFLVDFATLTGAARVALGPELPPFYTDNTEIAAKLSAVSQKISDPVWQLPLWENYYSDFESSHADMKNSGSAFAGSITAALFLKKFVDVKDWLHLDVYCYSPKDNGFSPKGGEIQGVRAVFELILSLYKK